MSRIRFEPSRLIRDIAGIGGSVLLLRDRVRQRYGPAPDHRASSTRGSAQGCPLPSQATVAG
jgi:hypothetical protein